MEVLSAEFTPVAMVTASSAEFYPVRYVRTAGGSTPLPIAPPGDTMHDNATAAIATDMVVAPLAAAFNEIQGRPTHTERPTAEPVAVTAKTGTTTVKSIDGPRDGLIDGPIDVPVAKPDDATLVEIPVRSEGVNGLAVLTDYPPVVLVTVSVAVGADT